MITSKQLRHTFLLFALFYSLLLFGEFYDVTWYLKPLLLPVLFYAVVRSNAFQSKKWLLAALLFSWIGDCVLLFADKGEMYFILGLIAFLIAHVLFIVLFSKQQSANQSFKKPLFWIGFAGATIYLAAMLSCLLPNLGDLRFPVIVYALTITIMLKTAMKGAFDWQEKSKYIVILGAGFFVLSDSILAINKFYSPVPLASFWIMLTYLIAQFYITSGILVLNEKK